MTQTAEIVESPKVYVERATARNYQQRLAVLQQYAEEIFDAILDATEDRYSTTFRRGVSQLLEKKGRARDYALDVMYTIIAPLLAEPQTRNNREYFMRQVIHRTKNRRYSSVLTALETTARLTYNRRWQLEQRVAAFYTQERHNMYMGIIDNICNF